MCIYTSHARNQILSFGSRATIPNGTLRRQLLWRCHLEICFHGTPHLGRVVHDFCREQWVFLVLLRRDCDGGLYTNSGGMAVASDGGGGRMLEGLLAPAEMAVYARSPL